MQLLGGKTGQAATEFASRRSFSNLTDSSASKSFRTPTNLAEGFSMNTLATPRSWCRDTHTLKWSEPHRTCWNSLKPTRVSTNTAFTQPLHTVHICWLKLESTVTSPHHTLQPTQNILVQVPQIFPRHPTALFAQQTQPPATGDPNCQLADTNHWAAVHPNMDTKQWPWRMET